MATASGPRASARARKAKPESKVTPIPAATVGTPAPAPKKRGPKPGSASRKRIVFALALMEDCRRRYEETEDTVVDIAADCGVEQTVIRRMARQNGWTRHAPAPRELSPATKLLRDTEALEQQRRARGPLPEDADILNDLLGIAQTELAAIKALRASMQTMPHPPSEGTQMARTLASLTASIDKIRRMRAAPLTKDSAEAHAYVPFDEDDRYATIDAFRDEIARRIKAFVDTEAGAEDAGQDG